MKIRVSCSLRHFRVYFYPKGRGQCIAEVSAWSQRAMGVRYAFGFEAALWLQTKRGAGGIHGPILAPGKSWRWGKTIFPAARWARVSNAEAGPFRTRRLGPVFVRDY